MPAGAEHFRGAFVRGEVPLAGRGQLGAPRHPHHPRPGQPNTLLGAVCVCVCVWVCLKGGGWLAARFFFLGGGRVEEKPTGKTPFVVVGSPVLTPKCLMGARGEKGRGRVDTFAFVRR